jgi:hypothetical protein
VSGKHAEQTSEELEPGDVVQIARKLRYKSTVDAKTSQKVSKMIVSTWGIQQRESAHAGVDPEKTSRNSTSADTELNLGDVEPVQAKKGRPHYQRSLQRPWIPEQRN